MPERISNLEHLEKILKALGFRKEDPNLAYMSSHEGLPSKAWFHPRPDSSDESLALVSYYDDGIVILRDYLQNDTKKETIWHLEDLDPACLEKHITL